MPQIVAALQSSMEFGIRMPESDERDVIVEAVRSAATSETITKDVLEEAITEGEEAFAARPDEPYVLVTSVSARHFDGLGPKEVGGKMSRFDRFLPVPFYGAHEEARQAGEDQVVGRLPDSANVLRAYAAVRVSASGRSHEEAQERALDALDLLRGVWNLGINRNIGDRTSIGVRRKPRQKVPGI